MECYFYDLFSAKVLYLRRRTECTAPLPDDDFCVFTFAVFVLFFERLLRTLLPDERLFLARRTLVLPPSRFATVLSIES
jgi:hypothetical protein